MAFVRCIRRLNVFLRTFSNSISHCHSVKYIHSSSTTSIIKQETINKIEQLSLVNIDGADSFTVLKAAIVFTEHLRNTKIDKEIEPMYSPFEKEFILLRDDNVENNTSRKEILMNAAVIEEEYFIAPLQTITKVS